MNRKRDAKGRFTKEDKIEEKISLENTQEEINSTPLTEEIKEEPIIKETINEENENEDINEKLEKKRAKKRKKKQKGGKNHLFSKALFKENFKSHLKSLLVVSLGNATIMAIIIGILSGLHINSTSNALKDLFGNADTESTVKEGAISFYSAFNGCAETFDTVKNGKKTLSTSVKKILDMPSSSGTITKIDALKVIYKGRYLLESGTEDEKHLAAKEFTLAEVKKTFTSQTPVEEQNATLTLVDQFFEEYKLDSSASTKVLLERAVKNSLANILAKNFNSSEKDKEELDILVKELVDAYYKEGSVKENVIEGYTLKLLKFASSEDQRTFTINLSEELTKAFEIDNAKYLSDPSIENEILKTRIIEESLKEIQSIAYLKFLPDFVVDYYTSNFGYPITYVPTGEFNENGTEKQKMIEIKVYNPDLYIKKDAKMGTNSNLVEKLHKEIITGEPYKQSEIDEAKEEANKELVILKTHIEDFFTDYIKNYDSYHNKGLIEDDLLIRKAVGLVKIQAANKLVEDFNNNNTTHISSIDEITVNNYSMDGKELMQYVDSYAASGITSYRTYKDDSIKNGYNEHESQLIAVARGSLGVINQLPSSIQDSLNEMGDMNTYGIIVGVIAFGIAVLLIPMVYTVLTANSLVAEKVESGSLAFTMSTPISRQSFIFTSGVYLIFTEVFMAVVLIAVSVIAQLLGGYIGSGDLLTSLPILDIVAYGFGNFMVSLAISGICFMSSCWFNKTNNNIGVSGGVSIFFFICAILGLFATKAIPGTIRIETMNIFNYCTIFSLFDSLAVMNGDWFLYFMKLIGLLAITVVTYIIGSIKFTKKDLPL